MKIKKGLYAAIQRDEDTYPTINKEIRWFYGKVLKTKKLNWAGIKQLYHITLKQTKQQEGILHIKEPLTAIETVLGKEEHSQITILYNANIDKTITAKTMKELKEQMVLESI